MWPFPKFSHGLALVSCLACLMAGPTLAQASDAESGPVPPPDPSHCKAGTQATIADCDAALVQTGDPKIRAQLFFKRAYLKNEQQLYESALSDLDDALRLDPGNAGYLHERGYTLGALGRYDEAIRDLDAQIALQPDRANGYTERAYSEFPAGRFEDLLRDRNKAVELQPGDGDALLARARAEMWLGRFDDARKDIDAAADLAKQQNKSDLQKDIEDLRKEFTFWTTASGAPDPGARCRGVWEAVKKDDRAFSEPTLIGDCYHGLLQDPGVESQGRASDDPLGRVAIQPGQRRRNQ